MSKKPDPIWIPNEDRIGSSNLKTYLTFVNKHFQKDFHNYEEIYNWSIHDIEDFWKSIWEYSDLIHSRSFSSVLEERVMPGAKWFKGSKLNFAENLLRFNDYQMALISIRENYPVLRMSYKKLNELVAKCAYGLKNLGVKKGDRVAGFVSNIPESVIAMLAATSLGAIWSSTSPDFGIDGVIDRFGQIEPKILFAIESYYYSGKKIECKEKIIQIAEKLSSVERVILINEFAEFINSDQRYEEVSKTNKFIYFNDLISNNSKQIEFIQSDFDHPVYIMYSSGTTGKPKCIVHGTGGTLLQHFKELHLHTDLKRSDKISYYTTCGWMMWNWLVSSLMLGASVVLIDGNPVYPNNENLWKKIEDEGITIFGTSPKYLSSIEKSGLIPKDHFNLSTLRTILSTGSPLSEGNFTWVYKNVKSDVMLSSISGGTDIISCFMLGCPILPVYSGEIQCRGLGMKVESWDEDGNILIDAKGELVCTEPFPSMPIYFWNDNENEKYRKVYFKRFPGVWHHGDFIKINSHGGVIVYGRSDATLNPGGVRIGTAEIYKIVDSFEEITDSLVIGQNWQGDIRVLLFVVLNNELLLDEALIQKIKNKIRSSATPRHVPSLVIQVQSVPHTISGKKVEIAVTRILNGEEIDNKESLANPESLEQYYTHYKTLKS